MKGWIIALIVVLVVILFVGLPVLIVVLFTLGTFGKFAKDIEKQGYCFTNDKKWGCGCSLMDKNDCKKNGGIHYKTYNDCKLKCKICGKIHGKYVCH